MSEPTGCWTTCTVGGEPVTVEQIISAVDEARRKLMELRSPFEVDIAIQYRIQCLPVLLEPRAVILSYCDDLEADTPHVTEGQP